VTDGEMSGVRAASRRNAALFALLAALALVVGTAWPAFATNDPLVSKQWGLVQVHAPEAWASATGRNVRIGIVDTGVFAGHEDLACKVVASANCVGGGGSCTGGGADDNGHGTHVAGIASAYKDNGRGGAGVAPDAQLVVAKVLDSSGSGDPGDVAAGIRWVVQNGARVVNLSLGDSGLAAALFSDNTFINAVNDAWSAGAVPVVASGNSRFFIFGGSANYGGMNALVVGATGPDGQPASYSSSIGSAKWGVMAPGGVGSGDSQDVISTYWDSKNPNATNSYAYLAGTSMATPHVTGAVADLLSRGYSQTDAVNRLVGTTTPIAGCAPSTCGHGLINVAAAVGPPAAGGQHATGSASGPAGPSGTSAGGGAAPRIVKSSSGVAPPASSSSVGSTTTDAPTSTVEPPAGDNPVVAAGAPHSASEPKGGSSGRAGQVAVAVGLLGAAGLGLSFAVRRLTGAAAP